MRAAVIARRGTPVAPNVEVVEDFPAPEAGPGEVIVRTQAAAMNHRDLDLGRGLPGRDLTYPLVAGSDGAGVVESVGQGVDESWLQRRVVLNAAIVRRDPVRPGIAPAAATRDMIGELTAGTLAEKFASPVANVLDIGEADPAEAAAFALTHLTAWRMLITRARLRAGQTVLITGIGGGMGLALLSVCRHFGCTTIVTSRHQWKLNKAAELGADHGVLDTGEDFSRAIRGLTSKRGVDICADSVGKAIHLSCIRSLARGGVFVTCGTTTGPDAVTDLARIFWNECTIIGSTMGDMDEFRQVLSLWRRGLIKPVIDTVYDAADSSGAFQRIESGEHFGKVVIRWP